MTRFLPNLPSLSLCQRPRVPPRSLVIGPMESKAEDRRVLHTNGFQLSGRGGQLRAFETWLRGCPPSVSTLGLDSASRSRCVRAAILIRYHYFWPDLCTFSSSEQLDPCRCVSHGGDMKWRRVHRARNVCAEKYAKKCRKYVPVTRNAHRRLVEV